MVVVQQWLQVPAMRWVSLARQQKPVQQHDVASEISTQVSDVAGNHKDVDRTNGVRSKKAYCA